MWVRGVGSNAVGNPTTTPVVCGPTPAHSGGPEALGRGRRFCKGIASSGWTILLVGLFHWWPPAGEAQQLSHTPRGRRCRSRSRWYGSAGEEGASAEVSLTSGRCCPHGRSRGALYIGLAHYASSLWSATMTHGAGLIFWVLIQMSPVQIGVPFDGKRARMKPTGLVEKFVSSRDAGMGRVRGCLITHVGELLGGSVSISGTRKSAT